jgi:hypothetical protein
MSADAISQATFGLMESSQGSSSSQTEKNHMRWNIQGHTAEDILVEYLITGANYVSYKNSDKTGKDRHCPTIADLIESQGVPGGRKAESAIMSKVSPRSFYMIHNGANSPLSID